MHVHRSRFDHPVVTPDTFEQAIAREHAVAVLDQVAQQFEFTAGEANRDPINGDRDGIEVGHEVLAAIDGRRPDFVGAAAA